MQLRDLICQAFGLKYKDIPLKPTLSANHYSIELRCYQVIKYSTALGNAKCYKRWTVDGKNEAVDEFDKP
jgi:hypothetical protein